MKFGVLYEIQRPTLDDNKAIEETIEQVVCRGALVDKARLDSVA